MSAAPLLPSAAVGEVLGVEDLLRGVRRHLRMEVAFVAEVVGDECVVRVVDSVAAGDLMRVGARFGYDRTYCRRVIEGLIPRVVPDVRAIADLAGLAVTDQLRIGSLAGVPLLRPDGTLYGVVCAYSAEPRQDMPAESEDLLRRFAAVAAARLPVAAARPRLTVTEPERARAGWWRDLSLRSKGAAVVAMPLLAMLVVGATGIYTAQQANETDDRAVRLLAVSSARSNTQRAVEKVESAARGYVATGDPVFLEPYETAAAEDYPEARQRLEMLPTDPETRRLVQQALPLADRQLAVYADAVSAAPAELGDPARVRSRLVDADRQMEQMQDAFADIRAREKVLKAEREAAVEAANARQRRVVFSVMTVGGLAASLGVLLFVRAVGRRLGRLQENATRLAERLPLLPGTGSDDEVGRLGRRLEQTAALLALEEVQLRGAREFFEHLVESGPVLIQRRRTGTLEVTYAGGSVTRMLGYSATEVTSSPAFWRDRVFPDDLVLLDDQLAGAVVRGDRVVSSEFRFRAADGGWRWLSSTVVLDADTGSSQDLCYLVDVTERRAAEDALRDARRAAELANETKTEFLSQMSHELRTPLNAVLGFTQLLTLDPSLSAHHGESLQQVLRAGRHLLQLIDEVLDIARIESGRIDVSLEPVPLAQLARESAELVHTLADQLGIVVEVRGGEGEVCVRGDVQRLKQVLMNLLTNAVKYNREGGRVWLEWATRGELVDISVTDTGLGMTPDQLSRLFTPFDRLGREASAVEGSGIGLALAHRLVTLMDGSLAVDSAADSGSRFTVTLQRAPKLSQPAVTAAPRARAPQPSPEVGAVPR